MINQTQQNARFADAIVAIAEEVASLRREKKYPWMRERRARFARLMIALDLDASQDNLGACLLVAEGEPEETPPNV